MQSYSDTLGAALARQKWVVLTTVLLTMTGAFGVKYVMPPVYQAQARVQVAPAAYTAPALLTEAQALRSSELAAAVITRLDLRAAPELTGQGPTAKPGFQARGLNAAAIPAPVLEEFQRRLNVQPVPGSYVLLISYVSADAETAARVANTLAELYIARRAAAASSAAAEPGIDLLKSRLESAEARLADGQTGHQAELAGLRAQQTEMARRYGPKHPRMIELAAQIAALEGAAPSSAPAIDLAALQAEIAATREALGRVIAAQDAAQRPGADSAKLVSGASVPATPLRIVPTWSYGIAAFIGLLLGLILAVVNEKLERRIGSLRNLESLTGQPAIGPVPLKNGAKQADAGYVLQKPASPAADAVRTLRASLRLLAEKQGRPLKVITVTSPQDDENRELLAIWLARLAARADEKVLLLDANLRDPKIHALLGHTNTPSLVDYLTGQTHLEQIVAKTDASGMHVIYASAVPNTAPDLIGSAKMTKLLGYLRQGYDLVVICAPGCLGAADASLLANESDHTLFVADTRLTDRGALLRGLKLFSGFGYTSLSPVLTDSRS